MGAFLMAGAKMVKVILDIPSKEYVLSDWGGE